jgi:hypothetical protein
MAEVKEYTSKRMSNKSDKKHAKKKERKIIDQILRRGEYDDLDQDIREQVKFCR